MKRALRTYEDPCGIARALDVLGERWALLIIRELTYGPKRFTELRDALVGASPNVLSHRLAELIRTGVIRRLTRGFELTEWGQALKPILMQLGRWGAQSASTSKRAMSVDALMLALETTFAPARSRDVWATCELRIGEDRMTATVANRELEIVRGSRKADVIITASAASLRAAVFTGQLDGVVFEGDAALGRAFLGLFERPLRPAEV